MNRRMLQVLMVIAAMMVAGFVMIQAVEAQECRVIRVQGMEVHGSIRVEPEVLTIGKGDCVVWFNRASAQEVKVVFAEGKRCASVSAAPMGFSLDHQQCYVTSWIGFGGTSSLRFLEAGRYDYEVQYTGGGTEEKGSRAVKGSILVE